MLMVASSPVGTVMEMRIELPVRVALLIGIGGKAWLLITPANSSPSTARRSITISKAWPWAVSATDQRPTGFTWAGTFVGAATGAASAIGVVSALPLALAQAVASSRTPARAMLVRSRIGSRIV